MVLEPEDLGAGAHDLLLRTYLKTDEAKELSKAFAKKRAPNTSRFGH